MISLLFVSSSVVLLFSLLLHHLCIVSTEKTHNAACKDLLAGKSRVRAMLLQENSKMFFLVTSNGDIFIEPMESLSLKVFPPTITLTEAKTHMKIYWNIRGEFEEHTGDTVHYLALRRNPDNVKETFLVLVKKDSTYICGYFGFKLQPGKVIPNPAVDICVERLSETLPDFWLGLLSQPLGMVWTSTQKGGKDRYAYCIIYSFPDPKQGNNLKCESVSPWKPKSQCLGYIAQGIDPKKDRPLAGFAYWDGNIAVLVHNTSTVYVYKNIQPKSGKLKEKSDDTLPEPLKYQIQDFIKCYEPKKNKKDKPPEEKPQKSEQDKKENGPPDPSDNENPTTESQGRQLTTILLVIGGIFLVLIGGWFLFKSKLAEVRPRKRKSKPIGDISKALAEWPQKGKASTPSPGKSSAPLKTPSTPRVSAIPEMLKKASKVILRPITPHSTTPATITSSPLTRRVSHTAKNPSKTPKTSPAESPASRRQSKASKASKASPVRPASSPVASRKVTKKLNSIKKSLVKSLASLKTRKKRS